MYLEKLHVFCCWSLVCAAIGEVGGHFHFWWWCPTGMATTLRKLGVNLFQSPAALWVPWWVWTGLCEDLKATTLEDLICLHANLSANKIFVIACLSIRGQEWVSRALTLFFRMLFKKAACCQLPFSGISVCYSCSFALSVYLQIGTGVHAASSAAFTLIYYSLAGWIWQNFKLW